VLHGSNTGKQKSTLQKHLTFQFDRNYPKSTKTYFKWRVGMAMLASYSSLLPIKEAFIHYKEALF
jgi:hypothetical protein